VAYTELGIINLALSRLGVAKITAAQWATPTTVQQAIDAYAVWEYIRDEVFEAKDWRFAKARTTLDRAIATPSHGYDYYYVLPRDFMRLAMGDNVDPAVYPIGIASQELPVGADSLLAQHIAKYSYKFETAQLETGLEKVTNGAFTGAATGWTLGTNWAYGTNTVVRTAHTAITTLSQAVATMASLPVIGEYYALEFDVVAIADGALIPSYGGVTGDPVTTTGTKYQILLASAVTGDLTFTPSTMGLTCTLDDISLIKVEDRLCILSDYEDSEDDPFYITYIRRITDVTRYTASFINALAWRLAAELSTTRTESAQKFQFCMEMYNRAINQAEGLNLSYDYLEDERGDDSWLNAGKSV